jgi:diguanylate cyclase (GGDEF)-like protein/PAS domain S-box-containing protein
MNEAITYQVLLVEDEPSDAQLVRLALRSVNEIRFEITWVTTLGDVLPHVYAQPIDIVLLDLSLPDSFGLDTVSSGRKMVGSLPIIVLTGHNDTGFALKALEAGAQDYLVKGQFEQEGLVRAIRYAISRAKLEQRLHESEQRMALALSGAELGLWDWHIPSGRVIFSPRWAQMLGYQVAELTATRTSWLGLVHPDDSHQANVALEAYLSGEKPTYQSEYRMRHKSRHWLWVHNIGQVIERDLNGRPLRAVGLHQDINERKTAQMRDRLLVSALEAVSHGIVITNTESRIEWVNPAFEKLTGYSFAEAIGQKPKNLVKSGLQKETFYHNMWETILAGKTWCGELINRRKNGQLYHEELTIAPVKDENGVISHFVGVKHDISERKSMQEQLWTMATCDFLTGLINRRYFMIKLEEEFNRVQRSHDYQVAVLMLDLDYFKRVNDSYGHAKGDALLKHFAAIVRNNLRKTDTAGRLGGEEFAIFLPDTAISAAHIFAERLCQQVCESPLAFDSVTVNITVSIGIAVIEVTDFSCDAALIRADNALYKAKAAGRNRVEILVNNGAIY